MPSVHLYIHIMCIHMYRVQRSMPDVFIGYSLHFPLSFYFYINTTTLILDTFPLSFLQRQNISLGFV